MGKKLNRMARRAIGEKPIADAVVTASVPRIVATTIGTRVADEDVSRMLNDATEKAMASYFAGEQFASQLRTAIRDALAPIIFDAVVTRLETLDDRIAREIDARWEEEVARQFRLAIDEAMGEVRKKFSERGK